MESRTFPCDSCGAKLEYSPGVSSLKCPYCGKENEIQEAGGEIEELDFEEFLKGAIDGEETIESRTVACRSCGAESTAEAHVTTSHCPFCGSQLMDKAHVHRMIKPRSLLPFKITKPDAEERFRKWIRKLRLAPGAVKKYARQAGSLKGIYIPYWTFDSFTTSRYTGERGIDYQVTERYHVKDSNGNLVAKTRQVTKTRWSPASGTVRNTFDDVLVLASESLPPDITDALEPWDLENLVAYQDEYLSGFQAEAYRIDLKQGFEYGKEIMDETIRRTIRADIGGDRQRIHTVKTRHDNITFKHILLPIWISAFRFKNRVYRFLINGRTGEVQGERPWSAIKIALLVMTIIAITIVLYLLAR